MTKARDAVRMLAAHGRGLPRANAALRALLLGALTWSLVAGDLGAQDLGQTIRKIVESEARYADFSGVALVSRGGEIVYQGAFGYANRDFQIPNRLSTKFNVGSITKTFTALAVMQLVERGKLHLDDPLEKYLPDCPIPEKGEITLRQLLTHSSGLDDVANSEAIMDGKFLYLTRLDQMLPYVYRSKLLFRPGTSVSYSSSGYILLGAILEKVTGTSYRAYLKKEILDPAGMTESGLFGVEETVPWRAEGYKETARHVYENRKLLDFPPSSAGGVLSTAGDLLRYEQALFDGELLSRPGLAELLKPRTEEVEGRGRVALAWWIDSFEGAKRIYHTGGTPGFSSSIDIYPETGTTIILLSNNWRGGTGWTGLRAKLNKAVTDAFCEAADPYSYSLQKGIDRLFDGDSKGALRRFEEVIAGDRPSARLAYYFAARARLIRDVELPVAVKDLDQFLERSTDPRLRKDAARAWYWKGKAAEGMGKKKQAVEAYQKALELDPANRPAREALKQ